MTNKELQEIKKTWAVGPGETRNTLLREGKMTTFFWHIHHDTLCEPALEPIENRIDYIKNYKPSNEIDTRLKLLKPVKGVLPEAFVKAGEAYDKAWEAYDKAWEAYDKAREARDKAWKACDKANEAFVKAREARDKAGEAYDKAREAYGKAGEAYDKAREAYDKAGEAYDKAREASAPEIEALHKSECPNCPWTGTTIFPGKEDK